MDTTPTLSLPAGTPIIAVGFKFTEPLDHRHVHSDKMPEIVLAGRLAEPFNETGRAMLLSPGPFARNIGGTGFKSITGGREGEQIVSFRNRICDEHYACLYLAMKDVRMVETIEDEKLYGKLVWPKHLPLAYAIAERIMTALRRLDTCTAGSLMLGE